MNVCGVLVQGGDTDRHDSSCHKCMTTCDINLHKAEQHYDLNLSITNSQFKRTPSSRCRKQRELGHGAVQLCVR